MDRFFAHSLVGTWLAVPFNRRDFWEELSLVHVGVFTRATRVAKERSGEDLEWQRCCSNAPIPRERLTHALRVLGARCPRWVDHGVVRNRTFAACTRRHDAGPRRVPTTPAVWSRDGPHPQGTLTRRGGPSARGAEVVEIGAYCLDATEVTAAAFDACVSAGQCRVPLGETRCNMGRPDRSNHPANCLGHREAGDYCAWAKKRLPTDDEWEYAARGDDGRTFPWGEAEPDQRLCWKRAGETDGTCPVASFSPSPTRSAK